MTIKAPTTVQDNSLKTGEVSLVDTILDTSNHIVAPGGTYQTPAITVSVPTGSQYRVIVSISMSFVFNDTINPNPRYQAQLSVLRDAFGVNSTYEADSAAAPPLSVIRSLTTNWTEILNPGSYDFTALFRNFGFSTVNITINQIFMTVTRIKA